MKDAFSLVLMGQGSFGCSLHHFIVIINILTLLNSDKYTCNYQWFGIRILIKQNVSAWYIYIALYVYIPHYKAYFKNTYPIDLCINLFSWLFSFAPYSETKVKA